MEDIVILIFLAIVALLATIFFLRIFIIGGIKVTKKSPVLSVLLFIFLPPVWAFWAGWAAFSD